jgi:cytochrome c oxidase subunit III
LSDTHSALAHHFDSLRQQNEATNLGMWAFLMTEVLFFGGLFAGYAVYRHAYPEAFVAASHHLDILLGSINTAILIASSLTMALAVHAAQLGHRKLIIIFLLGTIILGTAFLGIKVIEYSHKFEENLIPGLGFQFEGADPRQAALFFSFYFVMTGMHALHMIIGIVILLILVFLAWRGRFSKEYNSPVDMTGLYWHFVDIVWIFLFPLLYLIGLH